MSWSTEDGVHEGWAATVVAWEDGPAVVGFRGSSLVLDDGSLLPESETIGWRAACSCGWAGKRFSRKSHPMSVYVENPGTAYSAEGGPAPVWLESICHAEWIEHTGEQGRFDLVRNAAELCRAAEHRLDAAVIAARPGMTWEEIGRATGMSRQSAWERWSSRTSIPPQVDLARSSASCCGTGG